MSLEKIDHLKLLKFTGKDTRSFLQGQLSNDVEQIASNWQLSGYCNPKGRLLALLQLWCDENDVYALIDASVAEATIKRLRMYVMRSNVTIELLEQANCFACFSAEEHLGLDGLHIGEVKKLSESVFALSYEHRFLLVDLAQKLAGDAGNNWLCTDIIEGLPRVTAQSSELFIPQMLNLDVLNGVSFKKGCYTGQEIVARMHYLGKLKQRMYLCETANEEHAMNNGDKILIEGKNVGTIVNSVPNSKKVLAVLRTEAVSNGPFALENGEPLSVLIKQPYSLPE